MGDTKWLRVMPGPTWQHVHDKWILQQFGKAHELAVKAAVPLLVARHIYNVETYTFSRWKND